MAYRDKHGAIVFEQNPKGDPGNLGDSCAETFREALLTGDLFDDIQGATMLCQVFSTPQGYVRHPDSPWREDDFSGDQALPMFLFFVCARLRSRELEFEDRLKEAGWRTGNGRLISLQMITALTRAKNKSTSWIVDLPILLQAMALRLFSSLWSDSTADCLNHFHMLLFIERSGATTLSSRLAKLITSPAWLIERVENYYKKEPNSKWIVDRYKVAMYYDF